MYGAGTAASAAWRALFSRVFADAGVEVRFVEHGFPTPIDQLWRMPGLCCDFMCGWPFVRSERRMQAIAAPVPAPPRYEHLPRYCSEFLVRAESGWRSIEQIFGHRIGWMAENSQSGLNSPRAFLSTFLDAGSPSRTLFRESRGPYFTPSRLLDALRDREVDVVAVDGFYLDLLRLHAPARLASLVSVAQTPWVPIPLLVAAPEVPAATVAALRAHLVGLQHDASYAPLLAAVLLEGFAVPEVDAYRQLEDMAQSAIDRGYAAIG